MAVSLTSDLPGTSSEAGGDIRARSDSRDRLALLVPRPHSRRRTSRKRVRDVVVVPEGRKWSSCVISRERERREGSLRRERSIGVISISRPTIVIGTGGNSVETRCSSPPSSGRRRPAKRSEALAGDFDARCGDINRWIEEDREDIVRAVVVTRWSRLVVIRDPLPGRRIGVPRTRFRRTGRVEKARQRERKRERDMPGSHGTSHQDRSRTKRGL